MDKPLRITKESAWFHETELKMFLKGVPKNKKDCERFSEIFEIMTGQDFFLLPEKRADELYELCCNYISMKNGYFRQQHVPKARGGVNYSIPPILIFEYERANTSWNKSFQEREELVYNFFNTKKKIQGSHYASKEIDQFVQFKETGE